MTENGQGQYFAFKPETRLHMLQAAKLALSLVLYYWLALSMNLDELQYGALAIVIVSLSTTGATIETGLLRIVGTVVGVLFGFTVIACFSQDRWATMLAFAVYIGVLSYFLQASRYKYAWYAAAFIPLIVWSDNYPDFGSTFYFGTFRFLTTVIGVLTYTMIDLVFWPQTVGRQLWPLGAGLWKDLSTNYQDGCCALMDRTTATPSPDLSSRIASNMTKAMATLQQAYLDTPEMAGQRKAWETWRLQLRELVDAIDGWREAITDCQQRDLANQIPSMKPGLDIITHRLKRIGEYWEQLPGTHKTTCDDAELLATYQFEFARENAASAAHLDVAVLLSFTRELQQLERTSREMLGTMRCLAGVDSHRVLQGPSNFQQFVERSRWNPTFFVRALFPPAALIVGFLFWIYFNPTGGSKLAMMTGVFSIMIVRTPMNPLVLCALMVVSTFVVAPFYWLVMPALTTGGQLLMLVFVYAFVFGFLGGRSPALKTGPMIQFVMSTGISNQQVYSFEAIEAGAMTNLLGGMVVAMVYFMFRPLQPERVLLQTVRRFFRGCAGVARAFELGNATETESSTRRRYFVSFVRPGPVELESVRKEIHFKLQSDTKPEDLQRLQDNMQGIIYRLESLERACRNIAGYSYESVRSLKELAGQSQETAARVFDQWAKLPRVEGFESQRDTLNQLLDDVLHQIEEIRDAKQRGEVNENILIDTYTLMGCIRGLLNAMASTQATIQKINWNQLAASRL